MFLVCCYQYCDVYLHNNIWEMKTIEVTMQDIWAVTRPMVQRSKKAYSRKTKHKNKIFDKNG